MTQRFPLRAVASCFALTAFSVAIIAGLFAGRETDAILERAIVTLVVAQVVGMLLGLVARAAIAESMKQYEHDHPIPVADDLPVRSAEPIDVDPVAPLAEAA